MVTGNINVKIVFRTHLRQKWIDLHQTKTKMIVGLFYTYCWYSGNVSFFYKSVISNYPPGHAPNCLLICYWWSHWQNSSFLECGSQRCCYNYHRCINIPVKNSCRKRNKQLDLYRKSSNSSPDSNTGQGYAPFVVFVLIGADRLRPLLQDVQYYVINSRWGLHVKPRAVQNAYAFSAFSCGLFY